MFVIAIFADLASLVRTTGSLVVQSSRGMAAAMGIAGLALIGPHGLYTNVYKVAIPSVSQIPNVGTMANIDARDKHLVFLEIAKKDLEASKCLYENKLYPQAIFHLQQSSEKAVKSSISWLEAVSGRDLKTHNARKLLLEMIITPMANALEETRERLIRILRQRRFIRKLERDIRLLYHELPKSPELPPVRHLLRRIVTIITGFLESFSFQRPINEIREFDEAVRRYGWNLPEEFYNEIINFIDEINRFKNELIELLAQSGSELRLEVGELLEVDREFALFIKFTLFISTIFSLYLLLLPLSEYYNTVTRYPVDGSNPLETFNDESPLVRKLKKYIEITEGVLSELDSIYREQSPELMEAIRQLIERSGA